VPAVPSGPPDAAPRLSRRHVLGLGLATTAAATVGVTELGPLATAAPPAAATPPALFQTRFTRPERLLPRRQTRTTDYFRVTMRSVRLPVLPGVSTELWTYNGSFPGPTIAATAGRRVVVHQVNHLPQPTSVHLHGGSTSQAHDGAAMDPILPGGSRTYEYANAQRGATLWMHDHVHHQEAENVYRGLSNVYTLRDQVEARLPLPGGRYDVPLVVRDAQFDGHGQLVYTMGDELNRTTILVNGRAWPVMEVEGRRYRFRMVNSSNLRFFVLRLSNGAPVSLIGTDGGLLASPVVTPVLVVTPGERVDFVVDFAQFAPGTQIVLENLIGPGPVEQVGTVMRFDVGAKTRDPSSVPGTLSVLPPLRRATVERSFDLSMDGTDPAGGMGPMGYINGQVFDHDRIDTRIRWGATEEWTVRNVGTTIPHNFHTHLVPFRVVERDGAAPDPAEAGWKDTVALFPGQSVKIRLTFDTYRGVFPYHCHMIDHSAMGMMAQMKIS
jgi:spore coat protein A